MKERFRQSMAWLHTWTGLIVGWVLFFIFLTGTIGYFHHTVSRWMRPELPLESRRHMISAEAGYPLMQSFLERHAAGADHWGMDLPRQEPGRGSLSVWWEMPETGPPQDTEARFGDAVVDPATGERRQEVARATGGGEVLYGMHYNLHYLPETWGWYVVGVCSMVMLVALVTGVVTHRKLFRDFFLFRPGRGLVSWLDAHAVVGVAALPFFLMITYSGLAFFAFNYHPAVIHMFFKGDIDHLYEALHGHQDGEHDEPGNLERRSGEALPLPSVLDYVTRAKALWPDSAVTGIRVDFPGDRNASVTLFRRTLPTPGSAGTLRFNVASGEPIPDSSGEHGWAHDAEEVLSTLHRGHFAGPLLRWLYFGSGLLGCLLIATGLILWTTKRRAPRPDSAEPGFGYRLVECLNVGTVVGLPAAIAAYLWSNRLIPADWGHRSQWEVHLLFMTWVALLLYPAFRPALKAWRDELRLAALLLGLLPLLNLLTSQRHLGMTIPAGDWELAGMDLTLLGMGLLLAWASIRVNRHLQKREFTTDVSRPADGGRAA